MSLDLNTARSRWLAPQNLEYNADLYGRCEVDIKTLMSGRFIESVVDAYRAARVPIQPHPKLSRGESRAIASETEDRFAYYLIDRLKNVDHIFINQTITSVLHGAKERIKPDLVICHGEEIRALIDLKMDLGYKRTEFSESMK